MTKIEYNVHEYAKTRRCFLHEFSASDKPILSLLSLNFNKRGLGERNSDTFENIKIHHYFLNRIFIVIGCKLFSRLGLPLTLANTPNLCGLYFSTLSIEEGPAVLLPCGIFCRPCVCVLVAALQHRREELGDGGPCEHPRD